MQPDEAGSRHHLQDAEPPERPIDADAHDHQAAEEGAGQQWPQAEQLDGRADLRIAEADVLVEGRGQIARHGIAQLVEQDEQQQPDGTIALHEVADRVPQDLMQMMGARRGLCLGFRCQQGHQHAGAQGRGHDQVGHAEADHVGQHQATGRGHQHADAVAIDIEAGAQPQLVVRQMLAPIGVDHDVLGGAEEADRQRDGAHGQRRHVRVLQGKQRDQCGQGQLGDHQPATAPTEHRRHDAVQQWRPQKLEGIGQADEREQAHGVQ